jgi:hypothetical protein
MLSEQAPALLSESRALLDSQLSDKDLFIAQQEEENPFAVWDGDDMTIEMLTDANDDNVDEEASPLSSFNSSLPDHFPDGQGAEKSTRNAHQENTTLHTSSGTCANILSCSAARSSGRNPNAS